MRIGINCGHTVSGTIGSGAVGYINESNETREVGNRLINILVRDGHQAFDCTNDRASSVSENLSAICVMANAQPLDLFVSIHFNSGGGKGCEVFTYGGQQHREAVAVCNELNKLGFVNRGIKDGSGLAVVRRSSAKAMLIEVCFVDTKTDVDLYNSVGAERIAQAIYSGITGQMSEGEDMASFEERISALEEKVNEPEMIYNYIDDNMPQWAHEAVQWCVDTGIIHGTDENGSLGLNDNKLWQCVVMYRLAQLLGE